MPFLWCSAAVFAQSTLSTAVATYCIACHNPRLSEAKVQLDGLHAQRPWEQADLWERVLRQLRARAMPPADNPRPDPKTYAAMISELEGALDAAPNAPAASAAVSGRELATRLAKLLWNAGPDAALLDLAAKDRLQDLAVLERQVQRMLADSRSAALAEGFFDPWLGLDRLSNMPVDTAAFPEFDLPLRQALRRETELFIQSQLRENRPAVEIWTANYTYLDATASHACMESPTSPGRSFAASRSTEPGAPACWDKPAFSPPLPC